MIHADINLLDQQAVIHYIESFKNLNFIQFLENIIPTSVIDPFVKSDLLQILFLAILFGISLLVVGQTNAKMVLDFMEKFTKILFQILRIILYSASFGVFGAMAFTIAKFGSQFFIPLLGLIGCFYLSGLLFIFLMLNLVARVKHAH
jgi:aerobic C4-dicarboxylate transport protein